MDRVSTGESNRSTNSLKSPESMHDQIQVTLKLPEIQFFENVPSHIPCTFRRLFATIYINLLEWTLESKQWLFDWTAVGYRLRKTEMGIKPNRIYGQTEYAPHMYRVLVVREHFQWILFIIGKYLQWMSQQESVLYATEVKSTCMRVYLHGICCIVPNWASSHSIFTFYCFWHYLVSVPEPYATLKWFYVSVSVLIKVLAESHSKKKLVLLFHLFF